MNLNILQKFVPEKLKATTKNFSTQLKSTLKHFTSTDDILSKTRIIEHVNSLI